MSTAPSTSRRFQVALSFPGEHRAVIEPIAQRLAQKFGEDAVLYDKFHEAEFARPNLNAYLPGLYRTESELVVVVLCAEYAKKTWCKLEWRHIATFLAQADEARIMFLRIGDIPDPKALADIGILDIDGYIEIKNRQAKDVADLIQKRLDLNRGTLGP